MPNASFRYIELQITGIMINKIKRNVEITFFTLLLSEGASSFADRPN